MTGVQTCALPISFNARRHELARAYFERIDRTLGLELPPADFDNSNWHLFQVLLPQNTPRTTFIARMKALGIGIGVHYPAMHLFELFRQLGHRPGDFPHAENIGRRTVSLPMFPAMKNEDVERVCSALGQALAA